MLVLLGEEPLHFNGYDSFRSVNFDGFTLSRTLLNATPSLFVFVFNDLLSLNRKKQIVMKLHPVAPHSLYCIAYR